MSDQPTILTSPLEFVLVGPAGGRDRVLVRSQRLGLDLIGLAAQPRKSAAGSDILTTLLGREGSQINAVSSAAQPDIDFDADRRLSEFTFAWKGFASRHDIERITKALDLQLPEAHRAIAGKNRSEIEWAIAPLVYACKTASERRLRFRRFTIATGILYAGLTLIAATIWVVFFFVNRSTFY